MTVPQASLIVAIVASIVLPIVFTMLRLAVKWTKVELAITTMSDRMENLIKDKERAHLELATTIREDRKTITEQLTLDRAANDRRLRWLEERLWKVDK